MNSLPRSFKIATIWLLLGTVVFLAALWWESAQNATRLTIGDEAIEIKRARDGHYYWKGVINGVEVDFLIDTGATMTSIPESIAQKTQLPYGTTIEVSTANGNITSHTVKGDLCLEGEVCVNNLQMAVLPARSSHALLGMNVINKLNWNQKNGVMRFER